MNFNSENTENENTHFISLIFINISFESTVKNVNKGHIRERQHVPFINKWPLFRGYIVIFKQGKVTEV